MTELQLHALLLETPLTFVLLQTNNIYTLAVLLRVICCLQGHQEFCNRSGRDHFVVCWCWVLLPRTQTVNEEPHTQPNPAMPHSCATNSNANADTHRYDNDCYTTDNASFEREPYSLYVQYFTFNSQLTTPEASLACLSFSLMTFVALTI